MTQDTRGAGMLEVLAVDDEKPALDELVFLLREQSAVGLVHPAPDAADALRILRDRPIDAVFLDINMPGLDGLELAGILAAFADPPAVVFVTAHDDRAVAAFDLGAVDYLLKPLRSERLAEAVRRIGVRDPRAEPATAAGSPEPAPSAAPDEVIPVELAGVTTLVHRSEVAWVAADGDYARLHTRSGAHLVRIPLAALETRWRDAGFFRVHRSYLVALRLVTGLRNEGAATVVCLRGDGRAEPVELPVSRRQVRELKQQLVHGPRRRWSRR